MGSDGSSDSDSAIVVVHIKNAMMYHTNEV